MFAILLMKNCAGQYIPIKTVGPAAVLETWMQNDTMCFPVAVIQKVLIAAEQKKVLDQQVTILNERITVLGDIIKNLNDKDVETVATYTKQLKLATEQKDLLLAELKLYEKKLRKERRKRWWTAAGGVVSSGALIYLYVTK